jgi:tetratricopeptide (TPR) repeat protein
MVMGSVRHPLAALLVLAAAAPPLAAQTAAEAQLCERQLDAKQFPDARAQAQAAVRAAPGSAQAAFYQGCLAMADEKWDRAEDHFAAAIKANERSAVYHFWLGRALGEQAQNANKIKQGMLAPKVKREFERAVALDPDYLDAREGLIEFYVQAPGFMGGSVEKARQQAAEIKRRSPYRGGFRVASLAMQTRDTAAALREYEALATQFPDSTAAHANLVATYLASRRHDDAWRAADRFAAAHPERLYAGYLVGRVAAESGKNLDRGEREMKRYIARGTPPANEAPLANAHWRLGAIYEKRGQRDQARTEYQTALRLNPKLDGAKQSLAKLK